MRVKFQQGLDEAGFACATRGRNDKQISGVIHKKWLLTGVEKIKLFYVLHLKLGISFKVLIFMDISPWGRCLTPRFTPQNTWASMNRHEALRVSSINLATNCNLIRQVFAAVWFWINHFASENCDEFQNHVEALGLNYAELARACAVKLPTSCNWAHGKTKSIKGGPFFVLQKRLALSLNG